MPQTTEREVVSRDEFVKFLDEVASLRLERVKPLRIATPPFDKIYSTTHMIWIRELLNGSLDEKRAIGMMMMATLEMTHLCKSSIWPVGRGMRILMDDVSPPNSAEDIEFFTNQARYAVDNGDLKGKLYELGGDFNVRPRDLLDWATNSRMPVNKEIALAIRNGHLGCVGQKAFSFRGKKGDTADRDRKLQERADELKRRNPDWSKNEIAIQMAREHFDLSKDRINHIIKI